MKKSLLTLLAVAAALPAVAQLNGDGYYRIKNYKTERWCYVVDDRAWQDTGATSVDVEAIDLWKDLNRALPMPSSVIYIKQEGSGYDLQNQGTSVSGLINMTAKITPRSGEDNAYNIHGTRSGMTKYLADGQASETKPKGAMRDNGKPSQQNAWWSFYAVSAEGDNYFGIQPTVEAAGSHYGTVYASWPMSFYSEGMEAYYVTRVADGQAVYEKIEGPIASSTPVIIKCAGAEPTNNRMNVGTEGGVAPENSLLQGVYFCNDVRGRHFNCLDFDAATMRLLGTTSEGKLGFIVPDSVQYVPANSAYLVVPAGTPAELKLVTEDEFEAGVNDVVSDLQAVKAIINGQTITLAGVAAGERINVYSPSGSLVLSTLSPSFTLSSPGLYLISVRGKTLKVAL